MYPSFPSPFLSSQPTNQPQEYLHRPTSSLGYWPIPNSHILSSRDLARSTHGTWMGITTSGKVAVLTNYREKTSDQATGIHSRGAIVNSWLTSPATQRTHEFVQDLVDSNAVHTVGGFSLVCGYVGQPLAIISNRASGMEDIPWVATEREQTTGLSNTSFKDRSWRKILDGEKLMEQAVREHVEAEGKEDEDALVRRLLGVLSTDTLPRLPEGAKAETSIHHLRESIFIPVIGAKEDSEREQRPRAADEIAAACVDDKMGVPDQDVTSRGGTAKLDQNYMSGAYGTQKQTVLLVGFDGRVRYFERTLYDNDVNRIPDGKGDRSYEFTVSSG